MSKFTTSNQIVTGDANVSASNTNGKSKREDGASEITKGSDDPTPANLLVPNGSKKPDEKMLASNGTMKGSILRQSKYIVKGEGSPAKKGGTKGPKIAFREEPIVHEVENWKKFNVIDDEKPASACSCLVM